MLIVLSVQMKKKIHIPNSKFENSDPNIQQNLNQRKAQDETAQIKSSFTAP